MILIGVTGFRRCGKNTATRLLADRFGFREYGFADALRAMAFAVDPYISLVDAAPLVYERLEEGGDRWIVPPMMRYSQLVDRVGYELAKEVPDVRRYLQRLGTEGVRGTFGPQAWVNALDHRLTEDNPERACISDVRFQSEADYVRSRGGVLWRLIRPGVGGQDHHASETEMLSIPVDGTITATTLLDLGAGVISAARLVGLT